MKPFGFDRLVSDATAQLEAEIRYWHDLFDRSGAAMKVTSPIERLFYLSVVIRAMLSPFGRVNYTQSLDDVRDDGQLFAIPQASLMDWPVDFYFVRHEVADDFTKTTHRLVVECDGHDYHERTKEQASRDRARDRRLQTDGYTVFRFTGSEIHRDPYGCAGQVIDWFEGRKSTP